MKRLARIIHMLQMEMNHCSGVSILARPALVTRLPINLVSGSDTLLGE